MTIFDYLVIAILLASLLFGLLRGVVGELIALAAWALGIVASIRWGGQLGQMAFDGINDPNVRTMAGCVVVFVGVLVVMALIRMLVKSLVKALGLSVSDRLLGSLFGLARGVLVAMVLVALGGMTAAPQQAWWRQAMLSAPLETAVMVSRQWLPDELAKRIRFS
jgi:membrane protein required for colicin V production